MLDPSMLDGVAGDEETKRIRAEIFLATKEWGPALNLIQRIESGKVTLTLSEYNQMPKLFFDLWDFFKLKVKQYQDNRKK